MLLTIDEARKKRCWQSFPVWNELSPFASYREIDHALCIADSCMAWETVGDKGYCRMVGHDAVVNKVVADVPARFNALYEWVANGCDGVLSEAPPGTIKWTPLVARKPEDI